MTEPRQRPVLLVAAFVLVSCILASSVSVTMTGPGGNDSEVPNLPQWRMMLPALFLRSAIYARLPAADRR